MTHEFKTYLYVFCGKQKLTPTYTYENEDGAFYCEVRVAGYNFIGCGEARNKKDAQGLAAQQFCQFLARSGFIEPSSLPSLHTHPHSDNVSHPHEPPMPHPSHSPPMPHSSHPLPMPHTSHPPSMPHSSHLPPMPHSSHLPPMPHSSHLPPMPGPSWAKDVDVGAPDNYGVSMVTPLVPESNLERQQGVKRKFDQMSGEDTGNYTLETAKSRLFLYLEQTRQPKDMQIRPVGPDHNKSFVAEMRISVPKLHRTIHAQEHANTKKVAGNMLALNLVRQLYQLGVIDARRAPGEKQANEVEPSVVNLSDDTLSMLRRLLSDLKITPVSQPETMDEPTSMLLPLPKPSGNHDNTPSGVVEWKPPHIDWNPWVGHSAYREGGVYSELEPGARAARVSQDLYSELGRRKGEDSQLQKSLEARQVLPIATKASDIVSMIQRHPVVIIRGNTGCGKTTQVPQFILDSMIASGNGAQCNIVVTQPRRLSAMSVAERVCYERCEGLGTSVGYSVRFESVLPRHYASILFCTVGVLLRKLESGLVGVSHVIVDEVHERDINDD